MKNTTCSILLAGFLLLFAGNAWSKSIRESKVPPVVRTAFNSKYTNAHVHEWEWKKKEGQYKAEFMQTGRKHEAYFTAAGNWLYTECNLKKEDLPQPVKDSISKSKYAGWQLDDVEERSSPEQAKFYKVEVEQGNKERNLYFLADGTLLKDEADD